MTTRSDPRPVPLREPLRAALSMRQAALWRGRSRRKDQDRLNAAIGRVERFGPGRSILAAGFGQGQQRKFAAPGQPFGNFKAGGADRAIDEDAGAHDRLA